MHKKTITLFSWLLALLLALPILVACSGGTAVEGPPATSAPSEPSAPAEVNEFEIVLEAAAGWVANSSDWNVKAANLFLLLNDDDKGNDPKVVSIRGADDYAKGHIPGAVNLAFGNLVTDATLTKDDKTVVYCYTGQSASQATAVLGTLGYDVVNLLHGMCAWTKGPGVALKCFNPAAAQSDYALETTPNLPDSGKALPVLENTSATDSEAMLLAAAKTYTKPKFIAAKDVFMLINDDDESNDPIIISNRSPDDYAKGHIPGAVNLPIAKLFTKENLSRIPADKMVVVYCYTGHTAAQSTAMLNLLGYDAYSLKYGFCSWSPQSVKCFSDAARSDYATE